MGGYIYLFLCCFCFIFYFGEEIGSDITCHLSPMEIYFVLAIEKKSYFLENKNVFKMSSAEIFTLCNMLHVSVQKKKSDQEILNFVRMSEE